MGPDKMIVSPEQVEMKQQGLRRVIGCPIAAGERGKAMAQGQIEAFDERRLDFAGKIGIAQLLPDLGQSCGGYFARLAR